MLDNPIWHALCSRHADVALGDDVARRYPPSVTPFVGVCTANDAAAAAVDQLVESGERVGILGVIPPLGWPLAKRIEIHQYVWPGGGGAATLDPEARRLLEPDIPAMLELTALVYPAYFRAETARLGPYYGHFEGDRLVAMAGIRMALDGFQEISAICTHPAYRGRGLAGRLTRHLVHLIHAQGETPFLHTESDNPARAMYVKLGFRLHQTLPFHVYDRP